MQKITREATNEQLLYATILEKGMLVGLVLMFITFGLYVFGVMTPAIPLDQVAEYWTMPVHEYLAAINANYLQLEHPPTGWAWVAHVGKADFLNFVPIVILSGVTIVCYASIVPGLFRRGDKAMAIITIMTALILALAASGLLAVGH